MEKKDVCNNPSMGFPENKIVLLNGNVLDCFPKPCATEKIVSDDVKLDTTGRYLVIGKRRPAPVIPNELALKQEENRNFFLQNAFFFLNHADLIMRDSRMFLAPVEITNGLAYIGTNGFKSPTLGVYLEWWLSADCDNLYDEKGKEALTYHIAGSPLSGCNSCRCVYPDGTTEVISHRSFSGVWKSFVEVNRRYNEAKQIYASYTLQEVYEKLQNNEFSELSALKTTLVFRDYRIPTLERQIGELQKRLEHKQQKIHDLYIQYNQSELSRLREEYQKRKIIHQQEMQLLLEERRANKAKLHAGTMTTRDYQKSLVPIEEKKQAFIQYKSSLITTIVKDGAFNYETAEKWLEGDGE